MRKSQFSCQFKFKLELLSILAVCLLLYSSYATAADSSDDIEIKIESTTPRLTPGTGLGISAEITNKSQSIIYLYEKKITMYPPPQLVGSQDPTGWYGFFPTEHKEEDSNSSNNDSKEEDDSYSSYYEVSIAIRPGKSYKVFWYYNPASDIIQKSEDKRSASIFFPFYRYIPEFLKYNSYLISSELRFLFFKPGDYPITVSANYWKSPPMPTEKQGARDLYYTKIQDKALTVYAPQSIIIVGAFLGGIVSYFIIPDSRRRLISSTPPSSSRNILAIIGLGSANITGAMLLSAIITVLLARVSETQFLIRVTVADFWGGVAIGFIANYSGTELLNKIKNSATASNNQQNKNANGGNTDI